MGRKFKIAVQKLDHPVYNVFSEARFSVSDRLVMTRGSSERFRKSFEPAAVKFFNEQLPSLPSH